MPDHHAVLGVSRNADEAELKRAYRVLALQWHPDKNRDDPEAAKRFRAATEAYKALVTGAGAEYRSYDEIAKDHAETADAFYRAQEIAAKMAAMDSAELAGESAQPKQKFLQLGACVYVGDVKAGRPEGVGDLILGNGCVHHGTFEAGRASGAGVYFDANGSVTRGEWVDNKRAGAFTTIDPKGATWADKYDEAGKRVERKKIAPAVADAVTAAKCKHCGAKFHAEHNSKCRQHSGKWMAAAPPVDWKAFPEGGLWLCCGKLEKDTAEKCHIGVHEVEQVEVVPEERRVVEGGSEQEFVVRVSADGSGEVVVEETPSGGAAAPAVEIA